MKRFGGLIVALAVLALLAGSSHAALFNVRPITTPAGGLDPLQSVFAGIGSSINVYTEQESAAIFKPTGAGTSSAAFVAQITWGFTDQFGLYSLGNPAVDIKVIDAASVPGARSIISFDFLTGTVTTLDAGTFAVIDTQAGFFAPGTVPSFGFYFMSNGTNPLTGPYGTMYSEDSLNGGNAQALIFEGNGDDVTWTGNPGLNDIAHWYVAFEGAPNDGTFPFGSSSIDFNDMVVQLESVQPVPEPGTMMLLGSGLVGLAGWGRKKFRK